MKPITQCLQNLFQPHRRPMPARRRISGRLDGVARAKTGAAAEVLEERRVLDVALTVITHGLQFSEGPMPSYNDDPTDWIAEIARETDNAVNREGLGDLDHRFIPVRLEDIRYEDPDGLLQHWNGTHDFLVYDWASDSNNAAVPILDAGRHHQVIENAGLGLARMVRAWMRSVREVNPNEMFDVHFIGHSFGTLVNREAIEELANSPQADWLDYIKVTALDPVGLKPVAEPGGSASVNADRDKVLWYHPENQGVDAAANFYQTVDVIPQIIDVLPFLADNDGLFFGKPLDGREDGGAVAFYNRSVRIWDTTSGHELSILRGHQDQVTATAYSSDGRLLASASQDKTVRIFDTATGTELRTLRTHNNTVTSVAFSPNGQYLVSGGRDSAVRLFRVSDGQQLHVWNDAVNDVTNVAFSPDGNLVAASTGKNVRAWRISDHEPALFLTGATNDVAAIAFSPDGILLAAGSGHNVRLWNVADGSQRGILTGPTNDVASLAFAPGGQVLAVATGKHVRLWNVATQQVLQNFEAHADDLTSVAFRHDGVLATASKNETLKLWSQSGQLVNSIKLPNNGLRHIAFHPTNGSLAVVGYDENGGFVFDEDVTDDVKDRVFFLRGWFDSSAYHRELPYVFVDDVLEETGENFYRRRDSQDVLHVGVGGRVMNEYAQKPWTLQPGTPSGELIPRDPSPLPGESVTSPAPMSPPNLAGSHFVASADVIEVGGGSVRVDYAIMNSGQTTAGEHRIHFYLSRDNFISTEDRLLVTAVNAPLSGGQTIYGSQLLALPLPEDPIWAGPGTYTLGMIVDATQQVGESREDDNANRGQFLDRKSITAGNIVSDVNLRGEEFDVVTEPLDAGRGSEIRFRIRNTMPDRSAPFDVDFFLSNDRYVSLSDYKLGTYRVGGVDGNSVTPLLTTYLALPPIDHDYWRGDGEYSIGMVIDANLEIGETYEGDNASMSENQDYDALTISNTTQPNRPDLRVRTFLADPPPLTAGTPTFVGVPLSNTGTGTALAASDGFPAIKVGLYLSPDAQIDPASDYRLGGYETSLSVSGGGTRFVNLLVTLPNGGHSIWRHGNGQYFLGAIADEGDTVPELNEANNVSVAAINVHVQPPTDMPEVRISRTFPTVIEGNNGTIPAEFEARLSHAVSYPVSVDYRIEPSSATPGIDFVAQTHTIQFAPGTLSQIFAVSIISDTEVETDESVIVQLENPFLARIAPGENLGVATIRNDDLPRPGEVEGFVFHDLNGNSVRDAGEPGVAGQVVFLDRNGNGQFDAGEPRSISVNDEPNTDADETGRYWLANLETGEAILRLAAPNGWEQTAPVANGSQRVSVAAGASVTSAAFGVRHLNLPPTLDPIANLTINADGGEILIPLSGIGAGPGKRGDFAIAIDASHGSLFDSFTILHDPGSPLADLWLTPAVSADGGATISVTVIDGGIDGELGTDDDAAFSQSFDVTIVPSESWLPIEPVEPDEPAESPSLSGEVFDDRDADGIRGDDEAGVSGIVVFVDLNRDGEWNINEPDTTTDELGAFQFYGLDTGSYAVRIVAGEGVVQTTQLGGGDSITTVAVLSSGDAFEDQTVLDLLTAQRMETVLIDPSHQFDGDEYDWSDIDAVVLLNNYNWESGPIPESGQTALADFVLAGGGLVTVEWTLWNTYLGSGNLGLEAIFPAVVVDYASSGTATTYTRVADDAILNRDVPSEFTFDVASIDGVESYLEPKLGSITFYNSSNTNHAGVVGWSVPGGSGRVASFSTLGSPTELSNANYAQLFANSVLWVSTRDMMGEVIVVPGTDAAVAIEFGVHETTLAAPVVSLHAGVSTAAEEGGAEVEFVVSRGDAPLDEPLIVRYEITGTAENGEDFVMLEGEVTIAAGETSATIALVPIDDDRIEGVEDVTITLLPDDAYDLGDSIAATAEIHSDDHFTVSVGAEDADSAEVGLDPGEFIISREGASLETPLLVDYELSGTAANGVDFEPLTGTVLIEAGQSFAKVILRPIDDDLIETLEDVTLTLLSSDAYELDLDLVSATATIESDDRILVTLEVSDSAAAELNRDTAKFIVSRDANDLSAPLTVAYTMSGTATNGVDFETLRGTVTIPVGATAAAIMLKPIDDTLVELPETVTLTLNANADYELGDATEARATITSNDLYRVTLSTTDRKAAEARLDPATFVIRRSGASLAEPLIVNYAIAGDATNGSDYETLSGTAVIPAGSASTTIIVKPIDDALFERQERVSLSIVDSSLYAVDRRTDYVTIDSNDLDTRPTISLQATDAVGSETNNDTGTFRVTRTGDLSREIVVRYSIAGTATNGQDYETLTGTVVLPAGQATALIVVRVKDDALVERTEDVVLMILDDPAYLVSRTRQATVRIQSDDVATSPLLLRQTLPFADTDRVFASLPLLP